MVFLRSLFGWGYLLSCFSPSDYVINYWIFGKLQDFRETTRTVYALSKFTDSSLRKLATIYGKITQQIIILNYGHTSSSSGEGYVEECICDYPEARLFGITRGMDKGKKNIIHNIGQQKMRTMNRAQLQEKHTNSQPTLNILGWPGSKLQPF